MILLDIIEIKTYLNIEHNEDDVLITSLQLAAEAYLKNAGISVNYENELYNLAVKMLVGHWYDNREVIGKGYEIPYSFLSILIQLKR